MTSQRDLYCFCPYFLSLTTGLDVKTPDWVEEAQSKQVETGMAPDESAKEAGAKKMKEVKGYEIKEKKEEKATELSSSGASLVAVLIVVGIVAIIGRGLWKGIRRR